MQAMTIETKRALGGGRPVQCPCFLFGAKEANAGTEYQGIKQRLPFWCNETKTSRVAGRRSPWSPRWRHRQCFWQPKTNFSQDNLYQMFPFKMAIVGSLPAQYLGRRPGPLYIGIATTVEGWDRVLIRSRGDRTHPSSTPHQPKNTSHEVVIPLYCSSSTPEAIHHTTHWTRVLHHNGGPNQYKPCVPCVHRVA